MKKFVTLCLADFAGLLAARADEGMWLLKLMRQQHLEDSLRKAGLQLPPEALYSETSPSLRECVGIFGGGCTGEVVSADGLVLTNHHCGFNYVHAMSTLEHNYMKEGYFSKSRAEELPVPGLSFTFVLRVQDVTADVSAQAARGGADGYTAQSQSFLEPLAARLLKKSGLRKKKGVTARIVPYFGGNQFYLFYEQTFTDVRLVANPPFNVGQFGGNTDNWVWPRHNADFAMFRIYADKNGSPAGYSEKNVPLRCGKYLPISLRGVNEGEYTMVMGFPGRTSRYYTASEVALRTVSNAAVVLVGNPMLDYYKRLMDQSDSLRLKLEDTYFSYGNMVKNYGGMNEAVEKTRLIEAKKREEAAFREFARKSGRPEYRNIIERIDSLCAADTDTVYDGTLFRMALSWDFYVRPSLVEGYAVALKEGRRKDADAAREALLEYYDDYIAGVSPGIERGKVELLTPYYINNHRENEFPECLVGDWEAFVDTVFTQSLFLSRDRLEAALARGTADALLADPLYRYCKAYTDYRSRMFDASVERYNHRAGELRKIYVRGLCEMYDWAKAPDANFTLRMTYGHVRDLHPRDAVRYDWQTVLDGMFEVGSKTESDEFVIAR